MADEALSGPQMAVLQKAKQELMHRILTDIELRKLALDQSCRLFEKSVSGSPGEVIALARSMHGFLVDQGTEG